MPSRVVSREVLVASLTVAACMLVTAGAGCGDSEATGGAGQTAGITVGMPSSTTGTPSSQNASGSGSTTSSGSGSSSASTGGTTGCAPLPAASDPIVNVGPADDLVAAFDNAAEGTTILLADGTYDVPESGLWVRANRVTVRSASGNRDAVILDGNYAQTSGGILNVAGVSDVTIAELSIRRSRYHAIHVTANAMPADRVRIYRVHLSAPGEQTVKVNNADMGAFTDAGELACSTLELTQAGRDQVETYLPSGIPCYTGGIDAHASRDWVVRDNVIRGFWCDNGLSEHGIHFWRGSRGTTIERNLLEDNARGIGLGLDDSGRTYPDDPCGAGVTASHYGGVVRNNMIVATADGLFASPSGMDGGIALAWACNATVAHNTVASLASPFASIEWRFSKTTVNLVNNLVTHALVPRDGATATEAGNMTLASPAEFIDLVGHDVHLDPASNAIGAGDAQGKMLAPQDYDKQARPDAMPDVGADEVP